MAGVPADSPMAALANMRAGQPQPLGPGAQTGAPQGPAGPGAPMPAPAPPMPPQGPPAGAQGPQNGFPQVGQDPMAAFARATTGQGDPALMQFMLAELHKIYPQLKLADMKDGVAEMVGPTQEEFLGAAWAKHHKAKVAQVCNHGRGQRLRLSW